MPIFPGFCGGSYPAQAVVLDAEDTVNLYVEKAQSQGASSEAALLPTPGFTKLASVADVGGRAMLFAQGRFFAVFGGGFYEFDNTWTATKRGTVAIDANPAQIVSNGLVGGQLLIASGGNAYCFVLATNVLTQVLTGDATQVAYASGYGLAFNITTGKVRLSNLNDFTTWNASIFYQRSLFADPYQAMFVDANNLVWMIGTDTFEVRYNSGTGTQPFVPLSGLVGAYGIAAPFAWGRTAKGNVWLARNPDGLGQFVVSRGSAPDPVSHYAFNDAVAGYLRTAKIDDAEVVTHELNGHTFPVVTFPSAPATWAYDLEGASWAKRGQWNAKLGRYDVWAPRVHAVAFGQHVVGDRMTGRLWKLDPTAATEVDGTGIRRLRRSPHLQKDHQRIPIDRVELVLDAGLGLASGQGSDPQALLRVSQDGGKTWGNERRSGTGRIGEYRRRVFWDRVGVQSLGDLVFEVTHSDPVPWRIVSALVNNLERDRVAA